MILLWSSVLGGANHINVLEFRRLRNLETPPKVVGGWGPRKATFSVWKGAKTRTPPPNHFWGGFQIPEFSFSGALKMANSMGFPLFFGAILISKTPQKGGGGGGGPGFGTYPRRKCGFSWPRSPPTNFGGVSKFRGRLNSSTYIYVRRKPRSFGDGSPGRRHARKQEQKSSSRRPRIHTFLMRSSHKRILAGSPEGK